MSILNVAGLSKKLGDFTLSNMELRVEPGCVTGFIGSNGAGKTTTIKLILGLCSPDAGTIQLFGETLDPNKYNPEIKQRIGAVFDSCPFPPEVRVSAVQAIGRQTMSAWDDRQFTDLLSQFEIPLQKRIKELSRGMGMKLQMAFALAHDSQLLILDEATAGLDPLAREEVLDILRDFIADGERGILISTHITSDLEKVADWITCIDHGRQVFSKAAEDICDIAGVAHCRTSEAEQLIESKLFEPGSLHIVRRGFSTDVLVPNRAALRGAFPEIACERASIEEYMAFALEGERR